MIKHEGNAVAIKYITNVQCYEWTPVASLTKCYGIRIYIDGQPNNAALTALFTKEDERDTQFNSWVKIITYEQYQRPNS